MSDDNNHKSSAEHWKFNHDELLKRYHVREIIIKDLREIIKKLCDQTNSMAWYTNCSMCDEIIKEAENLLEKDYSDYKE